MSALHIEERITVSAPPARVWKFVLDPARVAACLPGAKLDGQEGPHTYLGTMKIKVGPVLMEMKGKASMSDINTEERSVKLTGTGNDKSGGGSAKMVMSSQILPTDDGGSIIVVNADVDLAGKLVRFGRGMMEGISKQLFKQFSERVRAELSEPDEEEEEAGAAEPESPEAQAPTPEKEAAPAVSAEEAAPQPTAPEAAVTEAPKEDSTTQAPNVSTESEKPTAETPQVEGSAAELTPAAAPEAEGKTKPPSTDANKTDDSQPVETVDRAKTEQPVSKPKPESTPAPEKKAAPVPAKPRSTAKKKAPSKAIAPVENEALDAGSLVWSAIWAWIKGLFARLFGKKDKG